jgi:UPF0755 protein
LGLAAPTPQLFSGPLTKPQPWWGRLAIAAVAGLLLALALLAFLAADFDAAGPSTKDTVLVVPKGASLSRAARDLEAAGIIADANRFRLLARLFGDERPIKAGEYEIPQSASMARVLSLLQSGSVLLHQITVSEGMPSIQVFERLRAEPLLTGDIALPAEGSILPETYSFTRGEPRQAVLDRMQNAMRRALADAWASRDENLPIATPEHAIILASIVEKETSKKSELALVAGVYVNRLNKGMKLQADPTVIYPLTKGKPLGRRIRQSELDAANGYNTYVIAGLPEGPIANPSKRAIEATLSPAKTDALFFVADGSGGHQFSRTYEEHNRNVAAWRRFRAEKGI